MRLPIQYAFSYPERWPAPLLPSLDLAGGGRARVRRARTPTRSRVCALAYRALDGERSLPVVLNAANEVAVARFSTGAWRSRRLPHVIEQTMGDHRGCRWPR